MSAVLTYLVRLVTWIAGPYVEIHEDDQIGENSMRPRW